MIPSEPGDDGTSRQGLHEPEKIIDQLNVSVI